ncbi:MAG: hypothetical protein KKC21_05735 [Nitrospinae bacterium]|nr:hypothetical protein [Nitrospinota bacterium]
MNNIKFEAVTSLKSIKSVASLAKEIWIEHYIPMIGQEQIDYMLKKYQSEQAILSQIKNEGYLYYLIKKNEKNIGYIGLHPKGEERELLLSKIYGSSRKSVGHFISP